MTDSDEALEAAVEYTRTLRDELFTLRGEVHALAFTLDAVIATHPNRAAMHTMWKQVLPTLTDELLDQGDGHLDQLEQQAWQRSLAHYSTLLETTKGRSIP